MGRSYNKRWKNQVLEMLESNHDVVLFEAVRASGELEISEAVPRLMELLKEDDWYVYMASIWSLSQIGGHGVEETLRELLDRAEDEEEATHLETALDNLAFTEGMPLYGLFEFDGDPGSNEGIDGLPFEDVS
jgi:HEAT repeat protein